MARSSDLPIRPFSSPAPMSSAEYARVVAQGLADWCGAREVDGPNIGKFYRENGSSYKATVQIAKVPGLTKGLRSFIALHPDLLICRMDPDKGLLISQKEAPDPDPIAELSANLKRLGYGNDVPLAAIENLLAPLKDDTSMRQFGSLMKTTGLCLKNGKVYGNQLPQQLKHKALRVNKAEAKQYPLVKKCLVMCH